MTTEEAVEGLRAGQWSEVRGQVRTWDWQPIFTMRLSPHGKNVNIVDCKGRTWPLRAVVRLCVYDWVPVKE
jgi:hypothetical protein